MSETMFIPVSDAVFVEQGVIWDEGQPPHYKVKIPNFLAKWDVWQYWERERFRSMEDNLKHGDILFDIGAESGWISAIYAKFVGPENVVLFEPTPEFWPNIKATWQANWKDNPRRTFCGLVSDKTDFSVECDYDDEYFAGWPNAAYIPRLIGATKYRYIHEHAHASPQIRIDDFVTTTGIVPQALTIDVEGAELLVLRGAERILRNERPLVWASLHPDLMLKNYGSAVDDVRDFMEKCGYYGENLATDHEMHVLFRTESQ